MHCYRCGRKLPDRTPQCANCGQVFNYGAGNGAEGAPVRPDDESAVVPSAPGTNTLERLMGENPDGTQTAVAETSEAIPIAAPSQPGAIEEPASDEDADSADLAADAAAADSGEPDITAVSVERPANLGDTAISVQLPDGIPDSLPVDVEADPAVGLKVGEVLSKRLELLSVLGNGPVGTVFKARDKKKGTVVAVKCVPPQRLETGRDRARFDAAIQAVKALSHPNLARIYGAGRDGDICFYLMPYLEGLPLRKLLEVKREEGRPFSFEEAEPIFIQLCQAIHFAHRSTIHGGLKPENIYVQVDSLKILDLGISRAFNPKDFWRMQADAGKDAYLAPEYSWKEPRVDRRADVYSLGVIFYEMLTLQLPEVGITTASELNAELPRSVDRILARALAAEPDDRYKDADELKADVQRVLGGDILADDLDAEPSEPSIPSDVSIDSVDVSVAASASELSEAEELEVEPTAAESVDTEEPDAELPGEPDELPPARATASTDESTGGGEDEIPEEERTPVGDVKPVEPLWVPEVKDGDAAPATARAKPESASSDSRGAPTHVQDEDVPTPEADDASLVTRTEADEPVPDGAADIQEPAADKDNGQATPSWLERDPNVPVPLTDPVSGPSSPDLPLVTGELDDDPIPLAKEASGEYDPPDGDDRTTGRTAADARTRGSERATRALPDRQGDRPTDRFAEPPPSGLDGLTEDAVHENVAAEDRVTAAAAPPSGAATDLGARGSEASTRVTEPKPGMVSDPPFTRPPRPVATGTGGGRPRRPGGPGVVTSDEPFRLRRSRTGSRFVLGLVFVVVLGIGLSFVVRLYWSEIKSGWEDAMASWSGRTTPVIPPGAACPEDMVEIPAGSFGYGSDRMDKDRDITERVEQRVNLNAYCIDRYEYPNTSGEAPRLSMNWHEASEACRRDGKRLCREVEWERACKGPESTRFPYGNDFQATLCNLGPASRGIIAAGSMTGCDSGFGVLDLSGNAWEWTADDFQPGDNPQERVVKGGASGRPAWAGRCAYREPRIATTADDSLSFRCCLDSARR